MSYYNSHQYQEGGYQGRPYDYAFTSPTAQRSSNQFQQGGYSDYPQQGEQQPSQHQFDHSAGSYYDAGDHMAAPSEDHARYPTNEYDMRENVQGYHNHSNSGGGGVGAPLSPTGEMEDEKYGNMPPGERDGLNHYSAYSAEPFGNGAAAGAMGGSYTGKSIWTREDKRAFQERSMFGKIAGPIFCVVILTIIIVVCAISFVFIYARPPALGLSGVSVPSPYIDASNNFGLNFTIDVAVSNPNSISATLTYLNADISSKNYSNLTLGHGSITNYKIQSNTNTTVHFPLNITLYNAQSDPTGLALRDVASQCGWTTGSSGSGSVTFNVKLNGKLSVLSLGIPIPVNIPITAQCPSLSEITSLVGSLTGGSDLGNVISGLLGGNVAQTISSVTGTGKRWILSELSDHAPEKLTAFVKRWREPSPKQHDLL